MTPSAPDTVPEIVTCTGGRSSSATVTKALSKIFSSSEATTEPIPAAIAVNCAFLLLLVVISPIPPSTDHTMFAVARTFAGTSLPSLSKPLTSNPTFSPTKTDASVGVTANDTISGTISVAAKSCVASAVTFSKLTEGGVNE